MPPTNRKPEEEFKEELVIEAWACDQKISQGKFPKVS